MHNCFCKRRKGISQIFYEPELFQHTEKQKYNEKRNYRPIFLHKCKQSEQFGK